MTQATRNGSESGHGAWLGLLAIIVGLLAASETQADDLSAACRGVLRPGWYGVLLVEADAASLEGPADPDGPIDPARWAAYHERCAKAGTALQTAYDKRLASGLSKPDALNQTRQADARLTLAELEAAAEELLHEPVTPEQKSVILRRAWARSTKGFLGVNEYVHAPLCMDTGLWLAGRQAAAGHAEQGGLVSPEVATQFADRTLRLREEFPAQRIEDWRRFGAMSPGDPQHARALAIAADYRRLVAWRALQLEWLDAAAAGLVKAGQPLQAAVLKAEFRADETPDLFGPLQFYRTLLPQTAPELSINPAAFSTWCLAAMDEHNQFAARYAEQFLETIAASRSTWPPSEALLPKIEALERLGDSMSVMEARHSRELLEQLKPDALTLRAEVEAMDGVRNDNEWNSWRMAVDMTRQMITAERVDPPPPGDKPAAGGQAPAAGSGK